uniref:Uncharacterized protein n=1 Tax=Setaria italica TaxID=4555 RepID=K3YKR9_SETIT
MCTFIKLTEQRNYTGQWNVHTAVRWLFPHEKPLTSPQSMPCRLVPTWFLHM